MPRRQVPADDAGLVLVVLVQHPAFPAAQVLADVVEVDVDGGRGTPAGPVAGRRVEDHLDIANSGLAVDQRAQRRVHLVDHTDQSGQRRGSEPAVAEPSWGHPALPHRAPLTCQRARSPAQAGHADDSIPRIRRVADPLISLDTERIVRPARWSGAGHRHRDQSGHSGRGLSAASARPAGAVGRGRAAGGLGLSRSRRSRPRSSSRRRRDRRAQRAAPVRGDRPSTLDPQASAVAEGDIEIGQVFGLQAKIIPVTSAGRWRGRHVIQLSNWGNAPAQLRMAAIDPDDALGFYLSPEYRQPASRRSGDGAAVGAYQTSVPARYAGAAALPGGRRAAGRGAGPPPAAGMGYGDPSRPVVDAALNQKPILSKGVITLLALLLAGIIALVAYLLIRGPIPDEPLAPRGSPPKPTLTVTSAAPDSIGLTWAPVDAAEQLQPAARRPQDRRRDQGRPAGGRGDLLHRPGLPPDTESVSGSACHGQRIDRAALGDGRAPRPDRAAIT